jgi:hypothetical protein
MLHDIMLKLKHQKLCEFISGTSYSKVSYINVETCPNDSYSIGIFVIPGRGKLPLHDHPSMMVCTKIICGKGKILQLGLVDRSA